MLTEKETKKILVGTGALLKGHFILSSGLRSPQYLQCAKLLMHPRLSEKICKSLAKKIKKKIKKIDLILSPALGGIIVGYEVARHLNVPSIFTERVDGVFKLRRGFSIKKKSKVLIVEDVITTAKSSLECSKVAKSFNSKILGFACIVDRSNGKSLLKNKIISQVKFDIPTYAKDNIPNNLRKIKPIKPGSRNLK